MNDYSRSYETSSDKKERKGKVTASRLNLRHSASQGAAIDEVIKFGTEVKILKEVGKDWYKVQVETDNKVGYVVKHFVEEI